MSLQNSRKFLLLLSLFLIPFLVRSQQSKPARITERFIKVPVVEALEQLEDKYQVRFFYDREWFIDDTLEIVLTNSDIEESVKAILTGLPFICRIINKCNVVFLPKDRAAVFLEHMTDYSSEYLLTQDVVLIGDIEDAGKSRTAEITGQITDSKTNEPVTGATVQVNDLPLGAVSNVVGNYKLSVAPGFYTLRVSSVGYEQRDYKVKIISDGTLNMELFDKTLTLDEIVVYSERVDKNVTGHQMSLVRLDMQSLKQLPVVAGGKDILKGLTAIPGVKSLGEFSSGINVRGGGEDQNLYLLNGTPLFNTSHIFGLFSVINPDIVTNLSLYKGHIPAIYGERVSSVIEIETISDPPDKPTIKGGFGLYDSRLSAAVPLFEDKVFFDLSGRTSYSDWILTRMNDINLKNSKASFYDISSGLHINLPDNIICVTMHSGLLRR